MPRYYNARGRRRFPRRLLWVIVAIIVLAVAAIIVVRRVYFANLKPVGSSQHITMFTIKSGESAGDIASSLEQDELIRSGAVFQWYISSHNVRSELQAGTYALKPSLSTPQIVGLFVNGKIATNYVTIIPGQRLDQIEQTFIKAGFKPGDVKQAFQPGQYKDYEALSDKPAGASLEGFLYPDSFQKNADTKPQYIIKESLNEMASHLTPKIRKAFANHGLSVYQAVTLASIVEKEVSDPSDRAKVAQVFYSRLKKHISLGSDVTAFYGAITRPPKSLHQLTKAEMLTYDTPYNTLIHKGLPPGPIGTVSKSSLEAVAYPAHTDWLYFVAGDNHKVYFSKTYAQHKDYTQKYCHKLCSGTR